MRTLRVSRSTALPPIGRLEKATSSGIIVSATSQIESDANV
ncbi:MAG: hypothetical protein AB1486_29835 [Planctomycetota bacterium]